MRVFEQLVALFGVGVVLVGCVLHCSVDDIMAALAAFMPDVLHLYAHCDWGEGQLAMKSSADSADHQEYQALNGNQLRDIIDAHHQHLTQQSPASSTSPPSSSSSSSTQSLSSRFSASVSSPSTLLPVVSSSVPPRFIRCVLLTACESSSLTGLTPCRSCYHVIVSTAVLSPAECRAYTQPLYMALLQGHSLDIAHQQALHSMWQDEITARVMLERGMIRGTDELFCLHSPAEGPSLAITYVPPHHQPLLRTGGDRRRDDHLACSQLGHTFSLQCSVVFGQLRHHVVVQYGQLPRPFAAFINNGRSSGSAGVAPGRDAVDNFVTLALIDGDEQLSKDRSWTESIYDVQQQRGRDAIKRRERLLESFDDLHRPAAAIRLEMLFSARAQTGHAWYHQQKVVVFGRAGIGKSTLCHNLAVRWARGSLWRGVMGQTAFHGVVLIKLREWWNRSGGFEGINPTEGHRLLARMVSAECHLSTSTTSASSSSSSSPLSSWSASDELVLDFLAHHGRQVLYIVDGYDEVASALSSYPARHQQRTHPLTTVLSYLLQLQGTCVIVTSRPLVVDSIAGMPLTPERFLVLQNIGFTDKQVAAFINRRCPAAEQQPATLVNHILSNRTLRGISHVPINLELICLVWQSSQAAITSLTSVTQLYSAITHLLLTRYAERRVPSADPLPDAECRRKREIAKRALVDSLSRLAHDAMRTNQILLSPLFYQHHDAGGRLTEWLRTGFVTKADSVSPRSSDAVLSLTEWVEGPSVCFIHLTFQEYFAAQFIVDRLLQHAKDEERESEPVQQALHTLRACKYHVRYELVMTFVAGLLARYHASTVSPPPPLSRDNGELRLIDMATAHYWQLIGDTHVDLIGIRALCVRLLCLNEFMEQAGVAREVAELEDGTAGSVAAEPAEVRRLQRAFNIAAASPGEQHERDQTSPSPSSPAAANVREAVSTRHIALLQSELARCMRDVVVLLTSRWPGQSFLHQALARCRCIRQLPELHMLYLADAEGSIQKMAAVDTGSSQEVYRLIGLFEQHPERRRELTPVLSRLARGEPLMKLLAEELLLEEMMWLGGGVAARGLLELGYEFPAEVIAVVRFIASNDGVSETGQVRAVEALGWIGVQQPMAVMQCLTTLAEGRVASLYSVQRAAVDALLLIHQHDDSRVSAEQRRDVRSLISRVMREVPYLDVKMAATEAMQSMCALKLKDLDQWKEVLTEPQYGWHSRLLATFVMQRVKCADEQILDLLIELVHREDEQWMVRQHATLAVGYVGLVSLPKAHRALETAIRSARCNAVVIAAAKSMLRLRVSADRSLIDWLAQQVSRGRTRGGGMVQPALLLSAAPLQRRHPRPGRVRVDRHTRPHHR